MVAFGIITVPSSPLERRLHDRAVGWGAAVAPRSAASAGTSSAAWRPGPRTSTATGSRAPRAGSSSTRSTTPPTGATCSSGPATRSSAGSSTWTATWPSRWRHPACPPDLTLAGFDWAHDDAVRRAHNEAFATHWGSSQRSPEEWQRWFTGDRHFRPDLSFVVLDGDEVAAYALCHRYPEEDELHGYTSGWLGQLGTRAPWRGRGLGTALLRRIVAAMQADGLGPRRPQRRQPERHRCARPSYEPRGLPAPQASGQAALRRVRRCDPRPRRPGGAAPSRSPSLWMTGRPGPGAPRGWPGRAMRARASSSRKPRCSTRRGHRDLRVDVHGDQCRRVVADRSRPGGARRASPRSVPVPAGPPRGDLGADGRVDDRR